MQVYLPDDLYEAVKRYKLPASRLLQEAVRANLCRRAAIEEANRYAEALIDHLGEPSVEDYSWAEALSRDVRRAEGLSQDLDQGVAPPAAGHPDGISLGL